MQAYHRHFTALDNIFQNRTRPHGRQLVHIAHQYQAAAQGQRIQQMVKENNIKHGRFIHNDSLRFQQITGIFAKLPCHRIFQQAVYCLRPFSGRHLQPPGGPACRRGQQNGTARALQHRQDTFYNGSLSCTRTACQSKYAKLQRRTDGILLGLCQFDTGFRFPFPYDFFHVDFSQAVRMVAQRTKHAGGTGFRPVQVFRIDKPLAAPVFRTEQIVGNHFVKNCFYFHVLYLQYLSRIPHQFLFRNTGMPAGCSQIQRKADSCPDAFLRCRFKAQ